LIPAGSISIIAGRSFYYAGTINRIAGDKYFLQEWNIK
jgi:hypothetical protein